MLSYEILIFHNTVLMKYNLPSLHMIKKLNACQGSSVKIRALAEHLLEILLSCPTDSVDPSLFLKIDSWILHWFLQQICLGELCFLFLFFWVFGTCFWFSSYIYIFYTLDICWCQIEVSYAVATIEHWLTVKCHLISQ